MKLARVLKQFYSATITIAGKYIRHSYIYIPTDQPTLFHTIIAFCLEAVVCASAETFDDGDFLDSILDEVFMPCVNTSSLSNWTRAAQQPSVVLVHNGSTGGDAETLSTAAAATEDARNDAATSTS